MDEKMPRAIIVGATGQDGTLLYQLLEEKKYQLFGIGRSRIITNTDTWRDTDSVNIGDYQQVTTIVKKIQPDEIYHLAAIHHSSQDPEPDPLSLFYQSYNVNVLSLFYFLEAIRLLSPKTRFFYAASSHLFGNPVTGPQDETTPINPLTIYGITKAFGLYLCRVYRSTHKVFASVGILYNHESWLRGEEFVSRKIVQGVIRCKADPNQRLILGDLWGEVDWGFAPDYVDAIQKILSLDEPDDYVIASGEKHSVEEFVRIAFEAVGLDWREFVEEQREIITRPSVLLIGNPDKLIRKTGWRRSLDFSGMVQTLVKKEGEAYER